MDAFAAEGVYLGGLGGYHNDRGANSTRREDHFGRARRHPAPTVAENLTNKYVLQLDRQARGRKASADRFFAEASARWASYGVDLGDWRANRRESTPHLE